MSEIYNEQWYVCGNKNENETPKEATKKKKKNHSQ